MGIRKNPYTTANIGSRISKMREIVCYTVQELAEEINTSFCYMREFESGDKSFSIITILKVINALNIPSDYLFAPKVDETFEPRITKNSIYGYSVKKLRTGKWYTISGIGDRIRTVRESRGCDFGKFCKLVGLAKTTLYQIESGRCGLSLDALLRISNVLNISTDYLLSGIIADSDNFDIDTSLINPLVLSSREYEMTDEMKELGMKMRFIRSVTGCTKCKLAKMSCSTITRIKQVESGTTPMTVEMLIALAEIYNCSANAIVKYYIGYFSD